MTEPKFVNLDSHPITVRDPQGHVRTVRPFRELAAFHWRTEQDCVCVGQHYASFPGLLSPFPQPEQEAAPAAQAAPVAPAGAGLAPVAGQGRYKATGDVLRPDGSVKQDAPVDGPDGDAPSDAQDDAGVDDEDRDESEDAGQDSEEDVEQDRPLEDIPGVGRVLASALRKAGFKSASAVAHCQDAKSLAKLGKVRGVKAPEALADAAQTLLGWEEVDDTTT